jgi:translocation and assembly module TamB
VSARGIPLVLLRVLLWGITAAIVLALGLGTTARGTALLARTLSLVEPRLVLAHRDGNLLEAGFERIAWHDAGLAVQLRDIAWTLSPRCLLTDTLCFEQLTIATLDIDIGPPSGQSSPLALAPVMLPLPLSVAHGTLATLGVRRGAETLLTLQDIALGGELRGSRIELQRLDARVGELAATLSGSVDLRAQLPLDVSGRLRRGPGDHADIRASGDLAHLAFSARSGGRYALDVEGRLDALARPLALTLTARSREALLLRPQQPGLAALHEATLTLEGTLAALRATLAARLESAALGTNAVTAAATWVPGRVDVGSFALEGDAGRLDASGHLETGAGRRWAVQARATDFCPTGWTPALRCAMSGTATLDGALGAPLQLAVEGALQGSVNDHPARIAGRVAALPDGRWQVEELRLASGANTLALDGSVGERIALDATLVIATLADTIATAAGTGGGSFSVRGSRADPQLRGALRLRDAAWNGIEAGSLVLEADWRGLAHADNSVRLSLGEARWQDIAGITLDASLAGSGPAHRIALEARAADAALGLDCSGALAIADGWRGECRRLDVAPSATQTPWRGDRMLRLAWQRKDGELRIEPFCLGRDSAALCSTRTAIFAPGRMAGIAIEGSDIPFAWLRPWLPAGVEADGNFDLHVAADKAAERNPRIEARASTGAMTLTALAAGEPLVFALSGASASLGTAGAGIALDWRLLLTGGARFDGEVLLQRGSGALSGTMALRELDLAPFAMLSPGVVAAAGTLGGDVRLEGSLREPRASGVLSLRGGMLGHEQLPQPVEDVMLDVEFTGAEARIAGRFATAAGAGTLEGTARFADAGWSADLGLQSAGLQLAPLRDSTLTVVPELRVRLDAQHAAISGELFIPRADIRLDQLPASAISVSPDAVIVGEEPATAPFDYSADLKVRLGDKVRLRGMGVDARLEGALEVVRDIGERRPRGRGEIQIADGRYTAYGQRLEVTEGVVRFRGPLDRPELRLTAVRRIEDENIQVGVRVRGYLRDPQLSTFSRPAMEESRALHYLLTGRAPAAGGNSDLVVTSMLMQLGVAGASGVTGNVLQGFGIQDFQLSTREVEGGTEVHLSGYVLPDLYLRYGVSTFDKVNTFRLRYRLRRSFYVEAVSGIENAVDFLYSFER